MPSSELDFNPYAAPKTEVSRIGPLGEGKDFVWREGNLLVLRHKVTPPRRCIKCNGAAEGPPYVKKFSWHPPGWYVLLVIIWPIYVVVYFFVRYKVRLMLDCGVVVSTGSSACYDSLDLLPRDL